jgi:predicted glycogen debranching enzyme
MPASRTLDTSLFRLEREQLLDLDQSLSREWLETDGLGGYASLTPIFCPTRRYHGLLVCRPPGNEHRHVFLSRFEERVTGPHGSFSISVARYSWLLSPKGHHSIQSFELRPYPSVLHAGRGLEIRREVLMQRGQPVVLCRYHVTPPLAGVTLTLRPIFPFREADALTTENEALDPTIELLPRGIRCRPYESLPPIHLTVGGARLEVEADPTWFRGTEFAEDEARGFPFQEDQFSPGVMTLQFGETGEAVVAASIGEPVGDPLAAWRRESRHRKTQARSFCETGRLPEARAALGAEDFLYQTPDGRLAVTAGFPWFGEWGRDSFIALPGLTLARGQLDRCGDSLFETLRYLRNGLLPNIFGETPEESHYGSADASLWFARAVLLYQQAGAPSARITEDFLPALAEIARSYYEGTDLGIAADESGLIMAGNDAVNATWMDAQTDDGPVTPRDGCAVELAGLWYSLLHHLEDLTGRVGDSASHEGWKSLRKLARKSFLHRFWLEDGQYLADTWKDGTPDPRVRPNMVIAASLEYSPLLRTQREGVVRRAAEELLTPYGLRTLSPRDHAYRAHYRGGPRERDEAYHQGTVWPWLLGFFCEASLRARGDSPEVREELAGLWSTLEEEMDRSGLSHLSEVHDGDPPHHAGGTFAQAWNTAEYLRSHALFARRCHP